MTEENVVQLPTPLERLTISFKDYLGREAANREEWIEIQEGICLTLVGIRDQFDADVEFGQHCRDNGFGEEIINHQTRAAAIAMAREPEALRKCLEATERRSLQLIYRSEFPGFTNASKPATRRKKQEKLPLPRSITEDQAEDIIHRHFELGETLRDITHAIINPAAKRQSLAVEKVAAIERGRRQGVAEQPEPPPIAPEAMPHSMRRRYEVALRKARLKLREEITAEINREYDVYVSRLNERHNWAERIIASHQGVMSREAFRKIKACLHPDHNTFKFAAEALQTFSDLEKVLVKAEAVFTGPALPTTAAELMARRWPHQR